ncbi:M24 family metallopeptidase [Salinarimonas rosea]|uniref:M24 family metallopeptidase n=1 Tax=Salinarimonas rosea TaxID=552063 RepID=UPI00041D3389|nr:Xaa-Pro peptidase family protein [Salinarimonas rosea]
MIDRLNRLRDRMAATGTDLVAIAPGAHMGWLLGFAPHPDERLCLLLVGRDQATFVMPALNAADARQHTDLPFCEWADADGPIQALNDALTRIGGTPARVGLDEAMRADFALTLLDFLPGVERSYAAETIGALRMSKTPDELHLLAENAAIADRAQAAVAAALRPGISEAELADVARSAFAAEGAQPQFAIVAIDGNSAFPHHHTGEARVGDRAVVLIDIGGRKQGYCSDITRMAILGEPPEGYREVHAVVDAAVEAALSAIRPGVRARAVDAAARGVIEAAGYGPYFTHRTGHGLGTEVHEGPYVTATSDTVLEPGMVFTIEPGIYLPGRFGVRLEEVAVVTSDGARILSSRSRAPATAGR